ncbi:MAG: protease modulator HflC [Candidatus Omnitrophica bacterium]|nr:protease modulator HflC [Candidatus Omnitrophota bacterium]
MNRLVTALVIGFVITLLLVITGVFYVVDETQQVVITQFGQPIGQPIRQAGLYMKTPFVQEVNRYDKRILEWDGEPNQIPTLDKRYIWVDLTARWRIKDPLKFMQSFGTESVAQARLDDILDSSARDLISSHNLVEVIRDTNAIIGRQSGAKQEVKDLDTISNDEDSLEPVSFGREALTREILKRAVPRLEEFGIQLVDIRIRRINYVQDVLRKVYERMISERKRAAEQYRSLGQGKKAEIEGKMARELEQIRSEAYRKAQEIIGSADAEAIRIYAEAYNRDPQFYGFLKTLETYRESIDANTTLMMSTNSDMFQLMKSMKTMQTQQ